MYEYKKCHTMKELRECLDRINKNGYEIVSVTCESGYTVFYKINNNIY